MGDYLKKAIEDGVFDDTWSTTTIRYMPLTDIYDESDNPEVRHCVAMKNNKREWLLLAGNDGTFEYESEKAARSDIRFFNQWKDKVCKGI